MATPTGGTKTLKPPKKTPDSSAGKSKRSPDDDETESLRPESSKGSVMTKSSTKLMTTKDYTEENEYLKNRIEDQARTIVMLRQKEVDQNQVSMTKEEYKKRNNELIEENIRLQKENKTLQDQSHRMFDGEIEARKQYIQDLEKRAAQLIVQYDDMQMKFREMESSVANKDFGLTEELAKEKGKLKEMQTKVDRVTGQLQQLTRLRARREPLQTSVHTFVKERNETLDFIMDRGKDIQDRQKENFVLYQQVEQLEQIVIKLQDELSKMKEKSSS